MNTAIKNETTLFYLILQAGAEKFTVRSTSQNQYAESWSLATNLAK